MKLYTEKSLHDFEPWSGATETYKYLDDHDLLDALEENLNDLYPDGMDETELNDLLWFDAETIFDWLGIEVNEDGEPVDADEVEPE